MTPKQISTENETYRDDMDTEDPAAFLGATSSAKTMADGSLRVTIDLNPADAIGAFTAFGSPGSPVAVARIKTEVALEKGRPKKVKGPYGEYAQSLVRSQFFRTPAVWQGIGTDEEFLDWIRRQKSALSGVYGEYIDGEGFSVPAHVRRVDLGSGTAIKPEYAAIPLTDKEHKRAHQHGDSEIGDDDWWRRMRIKYVEKWAYETLKRKMGYDSYTDIPPHRLVEWADQHDLVNYLPIFIINAEIEEHTQESEA